MTCEEALERLSAHLDGQNTPEEEAQLQAHLEGCPSCREILQAYTDLQQGLAALEVEPPPTLHARIMEQVRSQPAVRSTRRRFWIGGSTLVAAAAVALILLGGGWELLSPAKTESAPSPAVTLEAADVPTARELPEAASEEVDSTDANVEVTAKEAVPQNATEAEEEAAEATAVEPNQAVAPASTTPVTYDAVPQNPASDSTTTDALTIAPTDDDTQNAEGNGETAVPTPNTIIADSIPNTQDSAVALVAQLVDDPLHPAAATIVELKQMTTQTAADGKGTQYLSDAATVRTIIADYADLYVITPPEGLEQAGDAEPCAILVLTP